MNDIYTKDKPLFLNQFYLRILAIILMTCDHVGIVMLDYCHRGDSLFLAATVLRCIGRLAFPLFCMMQAEALNKSRHPWKYIIRLAATWGIMAAGEAILIYGFKISLSANPFTDLLCYALFITLLFKSKGWLKALSILPLAYVGLSYGVQMNAMINHVMVSWFPEFLQSGYNILGLFLVLGFYFAPKVVEFFSKHSLDEAGMSLDYFKETTSYQHLVNSIGITFMFITVLALWAIAYIDNGAYDVLWMRVHSYMPGYSETYCLLSAFIIMAYNGKRGYDSKPFRVFSYSYFAVHLILIVGIFFVIYGY